jgi:hypothetical protein
MPSPVTPAQAGVQLVSLIVFVKTSGTRWIPAYAGMTG